MERRRSLAIRILSALTPALIAGFLAFVAPPAAAAPPVLEWSGLRDGGARATDYGTAAILDPSSGDLLVGGEARDLVNGSDMLIRRLDRASGGEVWEVTWGVPVEANDMALTGMVGDGADHLLVGGYVRGCPT